MKSGKYHIKIKCSYTVLADSQSEALGVVMHSLAGAGMDIEPDGLEVYDSEPNRPGNNGAFNEDDE